MVGADPFITKSILHVTRSPWSIASITDDVAETFGRYVIDGAYEAAATGNGLHAIRSPGGAKDAFWADITPYESGSDHQVYQEGSFAIPAIYLRDSPDIYIHTNKDLPDNIEATKIKRSAFIAAASGWYLANLTTAQLPLLNLVYVNAIGRLGEEGRRAQTLGEADKLNLIDQATDRERRRLQSIRRFVTHPEPMLDQWLDSYDDVLEMTGNALGVTMWDARGSAQNRPYDPRVPVRVAEVQGALGTSTEWVAEKAGPAAEALAINKVRGSGDVQFEIVNFIDGRRTVSDIRDAVSAEFEPIELRVVSEYLELLAKIGATRFK
jgi:hypothetical protein